MENSIIEENEETKYETDEFKPKSGHDNN